MDGGGQIAADGVGGEVRRPGLHVSASLLIKIASVCCFLLAWHLATTTGAVSGVFLPSPAQVATQAVELIRSGDLFSSVLVSSERVFAGYVLAGIVAVPLGVVMAVWWPAKAIVDPFVSLLRPLPSITWIPLTILWLGIGEQQKVAIVFLGSWIYILFYTLSAVQRVDPFVSLLRPLPSITWIPLTILWLGIGDQQKVAIVFLGSWIYVLIYTLSAVQRVDPLLIRAARNLGATDFAVMWQVILPAALPGIISGMKITLAISW